MYLAIWENKRDSKDVRIYLNKTGFYKLKAFFKKGVGGNPVLEITKGDASPNDLERITKEYLIEHKVISSEDSFVSWEAMLSFSKGQKDDYLKSSNRSKREAKEVVQKAKKSGLVDTFVLRKAEAMSLDVSTIKFPEKLFIAVDHNQPNELVERLAEHPMVDVVVYDSNIGDIVIHGKGGNSIVISRVDCGINSKNELTKKLQDSTNPLINESERMKISQGVIPFFVMEGDVYSNAPELNIQKIDSFLSYLTVNQNVNVLPSLSIEHTVYLVLRLAKHLYFGKGYLPELRAVKPESFNDGKAFVLEGIPGVSPLVARNLLTVFGTIGAISKTSIDELVLVEGVGPKNALAIYNTFR